ncbi:unnamed protein product, partial [Staurois parvus]
DPRALGQTLDRLTGQRALGHQASGHLARQRAPRHLARQWLRVRSTGRHDSEAPGHQGTGWCLARQRASGSPGMTAGTGVARHQVIWQHAVAHRVTRHWDRLARQRASGHQASGHLACQRAPGTASSGKAEGTEARGHQVSTQRALSQLARQRALDQVPDHLDQQRASSQL